MAFVVSESSHHDRDTTSIGALMAVWAKTSTRTWKIKPPRKLAGATTRSGRRRRSHDYDTHGI
jgi:hypothetical protein